MLCAALAGAAVGVFVAEAQRQLPQALSHRAASRRSMAVSEINQIRQLSATAGTQKRADPLENAGNSDYYPVGGVTVPAQPFSAASGRSTFFTESLTEEGLSSSSVSSLG